MDAETVLSLKLKISRRQVYRMVTDWKMIPHERQPQNPFSKRKGPISVDMASVYCIAFGEQTTVEILEQMGKSADEIQVLLSKYRQANSLN
jgi:hypothetical protein